MSTRRTAPLRPNGDRSMSTTRRADRRWPPSCHGDEPSVSTTSAAASHDCEVGVVGGHDGLLAAGEVVEEPELAHRTAGRRFDHHDLGAEVGEDLAPQRSRHAPAEVEYEQSVQSPRCHAWH